MHYATKLRSKGFDRIFLYIVFLPIEQKPQIIFKFYLSLMSYQIAILVRGSIMNGKQNNTTE